MSRHLSLVYETAAGLRGRLSAVLGPQYHFCGLGCAGAWGLNESKAGDSTYSNLLPETVSTLAEFGASDGT
jgi:hypothetical protein